MKLNKNLLIAVGSLGVAGVVLYSLMGRKDSELPAFKNTPDNPAQLPPTSTPVSTQTGYGGYPPPSGFTKDDVRAVQQYLNKQYGERLDIDGEYGPLTKGAVVKYGGNFEGLLTYAKRGAGGVYGGASSIFNGLQGIDTSTLSLVHL